MIKNSHTLSQAMTPKQEAAIAAHGETLKQIFNPPADTDPARLRKQLRRLENKAHRLAEDYCNGIKDGETVEAESEEIMKKVRSVFAGSRVLGVPVFHNLDPRGFALKIKDGFCQHLRIYKDWGGYGILAPEIGKEGY